MAKIDVIVSKMEEFNRHAAPGSECPAWGDFVADCYDRLGDAPWSLSDADDPAEAPEDFSDYWLSVANGTNADYDSENGGRLDA